MQDYIHNSNQHLVSLNFSYEKPYKLNWQHSLAAMVSGGVASYSYQYKNPDIDYENNTKYKTIAVSANYALGYYPNTRTNIQVSASQQIGKFIFEEKNDMYSHSMIGANLNYYFSPNFRLAAECRFMYAPGRSNADGGFFSNTDRFSSLFNVQLTYSIF